MNEIEIREKVLEIIRPFVKEEGAMVDVGPETSILDDLKVNSARLVDIVLAFEDAFNVEIEDEDADRVKTIGDATSLLLGKVG